MKVKVKDFNLASTIECGQFFRYSKENGGYHVTSAGKKAFISQKGDIISFHGVSEDDYIAFWANFFDLERNYHEILEKLPKTDKVLARALSFAPGIRIMNQDPWETLICFILSANNRIPMIMKAVQNISERFGSEGALPAAPALSQASQEALLACKTGFRAKYLLNAAEYVRSGELAFDRAADIPTDELRGKLTAIKGVGEKIADCCLLFSMGRREVFPVDVWIARAVRTLYFGGKDVKTAEIQSFARERFGQFAGYANQYLFHYARMNNIV